MSLSRSQSWFPGRYVPVRGIHGIEVFSQRRAGVHLGVSKTTIHGTAAELRALAAQMWRAAEEVDPRQPATVRAA
jgi:hypothetical protein